MKGKNKKLSNPFSTGGGGDHFEAQVQASFVTLMLTGGYAPCLPCWPIVEVKLQGKIDGYNTDDLIVFVENPDFKERRKLLAQVKHSITVTERKTVLGEVIQAAWNDFNNPELFTPGKDAIALITGSLSAVDARTVPKLLAWAKTTKTVDEFFRNVQKANFSPPNSYEKLMAIQHHLTAANNGAEISDFDLYNFLNNFHLLGYDLGGEDGVVLSLLHSHISQFHQQYPHWLWPRIINFVQTWNQNAGTITRSNIPEDIQEAFQAKPVKDLPEEFKTPHKKPAATAWDQHPDATSLAFVVLIGAWDENNEHDIQALTQLLGIGYDTWLQKAREILHCPDSALSLNNGIWKVVNRVELWKLLGSRIFNKNLETFKYLAVSVLKEPDPAFELPPADRYKASIFGKMPKFSHLLRNGIAEGLAILGSHPEACINCFPEKPDITCAHTVREILTAADWVLWGSLDSVLPTLAEAVPEEFLTAVEKALRQNPPPFEQLFAQEGDGITGGNYLTGLLWALEGLAWESQYLVRVCVVLGGLASLDPGGRWANRPSSSLAKILLPWLPQTLADVDKRNVAMMTLLNEWPDIAWNLLLNLLPGQQQHTSNSYRPSWRKIIPDTWEKGVTEQEYWQQAAFFADTAVENAGYSITRLSELIDHFDKLPKSAFDNLVEVLTSEKISEFSEEQQLELWDHLTKFINGSSEEFVGRSDVLVHLRCFKHCN